MMGLAPLAAPVTALLLVVRIGSIGVAISSLESLAPALRPRAPRPAQRRGAAHQGAVAASRSPSSGRRARPLALTGARLVAALAVVAGGGSFAVARAGVIIIAVTTLLLRVRTPIGVHASGAMVMITFTAAALGLGRRDPAGAGLRARCSSRRRRAWPTSSLARASSAPAVVAGRPGGHPPSSTLMWGTGTRAPTLRAHPPPGVSALCWATMLGECSVPLALVAPLPAAVAAPRLPRVTFHVLTAIEMGLNSFIWAFWSTYPAIIFCWYWLHGARPRHVAGVTAADGPRAWRRPPPVRRERRQYAFRLACPAQIILRGLHAVPLGEVLLGPAARSPRPPASSAGTRGSAASGGSSQAEEVEHAPDASLSCASDHVLVPDLQGDHPRPGEELGSSAAHGRSARSPGAGRAPSQASRAWERVG